MNDEEIIDLYWQRTESAISESAQKYGTYCFAIAYNILSDKGDSDECVNDTWLKAWSALPPQRPNKLSLFFGRITRNLSFDKFNARKAQKRGGGKFISVLEELDECVPASKSAEEAAIDREVERIAKNGDGSPVSGKQDIITDFRN